MRPSLLLVIAVCVASLTRAASAAVAQDFDTPSYIDFSAPRFEVSATETNAVITVVRTGDYRKTASVDYKTQDGTAAGSVDFQPAGGTLVFSSGQSIKTISVPILRQSKPDAAKTFQVQLVQPGANTVIDMPNADVEIQQAGPPLAIAVSTSGLALNWPDVGLNYKLETQIDGVWTAVSTSPTATADGKLEVPIDPAAPMALFRLRLDSGN